MIAVMEIWLLSLLAGLVLNVLLPPFSRFEKLARRFVEINLMVGVGMLFLAILVDVVRRVDP